MLTNQNFKASDVDLLVVVSPLGLTMRDDRLIVLYLGQPEFLQGLLPPGQVEQPLHQPAWPLGHKPVSRALRQGQDSTKGLGHPRSGENSVVLVRSFPFALRIALHEVIEFGVDVGTPRYASGKKEILAFVTSHATDHGHMLDIESGSGNGKHTVWLPWMPR